MEGNSAPAPCAGGPAQAAGRRFRLLIVMDFLFSETGGTENQVIKIVRNLDRRRFDPHIVFLHGTDWIRENGHTLDCRIDAMSYNFLRHYDPRNVLAFLRLVALVRRARPDAVMTFFKISNVLGVFAGRLAGVGSIVSTRRDFGLWLDRWGTRLTKAANRHVRRIVTNSERVRSLTAQREGFDPERIIVIHNGIEANGRRSDPPPPDRIRRDLGLEEGSRVVGIVAGLRPMKRHGVFLRSARRILSSRRDVEFLVIGDGPERGSLETEASHLGIRDKVRFLGWRKDIPDLLSIMDVGVNCSSNEGLSNAIMEYMVHGVPCVVSDQGGNPELVTHGLNGYLFPDGDDGKLAGYLLELLADRALRERFASRSRDLVTTRLSIQGMVEQYQRFLETLRSEGQDGGVC